MGNILNADNKKKIDLFKKYFNLYFEDIRNYLYFKSSDIELSEDIAQEVFMALWENIEKLRIETAKVYLYKIAENKFKNHYNRKKIEYKFVSSLKETKVESPEFLMEFKEFDRLLQKTLSNLPEKSRIVFLMNRIDKLTYNEIAGRLGLSVKTVEKRMKKALDILSTLTNIKV